MINEPGIEIPGTFPKRESKIPTFECKNWGCPLNQREFGREFNYTDCTAAEAQLYMHDILHSPDANLLGDGVPAKTCKNRRNFNAFVEGLPERDQDTPQAE